MAIGKLPLPPLPGVTQVETKKEITQPAATVEPVKPVEVAKPVPAAVSADAAKAEKEPVPAKAVVQDPVPVVEPTAAPVEPEVSNVEEPPKRRRRAKPVSSFGFDFEPVKAYLESQLDLTTIDPEQAKVEIRALRDLQIAAARRVANLSIGVMDSSSQALEKYNQIKTLLK